MTVGTWAQAGQTHNHDHNHDHDHDHDHDDTTQDPQQAQEETTVDMDGQHTTASSADAVIQEHLATYVRQAVREGRRISGHATVVEDEGWDRAGRAHYGSRWESRRDRINAFVDRDGKVWLHRDRGNAGTMIHEAIHKYSSPAMIQQSQPLNEGVTEYFTRIVCAQVHPTLRRRNYQSNYTTAADLVGYTSEATVASAYFDGAIGALRDAFNIHRRAATAVRNGADTDDIITGGLGAMWDTAVGGVLDTDWSAFCQKCSDEDWDAARAMMR